tara:strand:+ start:3357 stop:3554 length:198 start_codon:yes stop_codon:yes gene_type:complete
MASQREEPLPIAPNEYDALNERVNRRTIELAFQRVENDVQLAKTQGDKDGSLAMRRFQFLLMGAS